MPNYLINGQVVDIGDTERGQIMRELLRETQRRIWATSSSSFNMAHGKWSWHNSQNNPFHWVVEAAGGADLPAASWASRLKRKHDYLGHKLNPNGVMAFFEGFAGWHRESLLFRNAMNSYEHDFCGGGGRVVRVLNLTANASFTTLGILAAISTGGTSAAAYATTRTAVATVARNAAVAFTVRGLRDASTRVGRQMSGDTSAAQGTLSEIGSNAVSSLSDAMMGEILGRFMRPLKDRIAAQALREFRRGRLGSTLTLDLFNERMDAAVMDAINSLPTAQMRDALTDVPAQSSANDCAQSVSRHLMANRNFVRQLERRLEN